MALTGVGELIQAEKELIQADFTRNAPNSRARAPRGHAANS